MICDADELRYRRPISFYFAIVTLGALGLFLALKYSENNAIREIAGALVAGAVISGMVVGFEDRREALRWKVEQEREIRRLKADDLREIEAAKLAWNREVDLRTFVVARSELAVSRSTMHRAFNQMVANARTNSLEVPRYELSPAVGSRIVEYIEHRQELLALGPMSASTKVSKAIAQWDDTSNFDGIYRLQRPSTGNFRISWLVHSLEEIDTWVEAEEKSWKAVVRSLRQHEKERYR